MSIGLLQPACARLAVLPEASFHSFERGRLASEWYNKPNVKNKEDQTYVAKPVRKGRNHAMVPGEFINFFTTLAAVGATLFGLIFVVISIKPEVTRAETTSVMRQAQAASCYGALLNPLVISLLALLPHATIDTITLIMSAIGLVTTLIMGLFLLRDSRGWVKKWTSVFLLLVGLVLFGFELFYAIQLDRAPGDSSTLYHLATLLVLIDLYGIARAWDLVGVRQFHIREVLSPLLSKGEEETTSDKSPAESLEDAPKPRN